MKYGTIHISNHSIHLIWDDDPYCPKPFPLILKQSTTKYGNTSIRITESPNKNEFKLYSKHLHPKDFVWAGTETLQVLRNDLSASKKEATCQLIQILTNQQEAPLEYVKPDSKIIDVSHTKTDSQSFPEKTIECKWFWKDSVLRTKQGQIIGIPKYNDWKKCICLRKDVTMKVRIKWNGLLKKYQVITISKNE